MSARVAHVGDARPRLDADPGPGALRDTRGHGVVSEHGLPGLAREVAAHPAAHHAEADETEGRGFTHRHSPALPFSSGRRSRRGHAGGQQRSGPVRFTGPPSVGARRRGGPRGGPRRLVFVARSLHRELPASSPGVPECRVREAERPARFVLVFPLLRLPQAFPQPFGPQHRVACDLPRLRENLDFSPLRAAPAAVFQQVSRDSSAARATSRSMDSISPSKAAAAAVSPSARGTSPRAPQSLRAAFRVSPVSGSAGGVPRRLRPSHAASPSAASSLR